MGLFDSFSVAGLYDKCVGKLCLDFFQVSGSGIDRRIRTISVFYSTAISIRLHILEALESFVTLSYGGWSGQKLYFIYYGRSVRRLGTRNCLVRATFRLRLGGGDRLDGTLMCRIFLDVTPEAFR